VNVTSHSEVSATQLLRIGLLWLAAVGGASSAFAQTDASVISSSQIKAAFLYNFTKFVEWPADTFVAADRPLTIGVLRDNALTVDLRAIVDDRIVNGRSIVVRTIRDAADVEGIQLLFVGAEEGDRFLDLLPVIDGAPVLTVGESPAFIEAGGAIAFVQQGTKLRFEINMLSAERARLKISAQLQELAVAVRRAQ
jgi:hypothetical protein